MKVKLILGLLLFILSSSFYSASNKKSFTQVKKGTLPIVISVPHDGQSKPIWMKSKGKEHSDRYTKNLALEISKEIKRLSDKTPTLVIFDLHRSKIDVNRKQENAYKTKYGTKFYHEYHYKIEEALNQKEDVLYIDLHGFKNKDYEIQLGFNYSNKSLKKGKRYINKYYKNSTIKNVEDKYDFIYGYGSVSYVMQNESYNVVPSYENKYFKGKGKYFNGGYSIETHTNSNNVTGIQIEVEKSLRFNKYKRRVLAKRLAKAILSTYNKIK